VTVIAHSLGGIASFDLLAGADAPEVARLVTVGSQSPLMYEIGALPSLKRPTCLPAKFPPWLNIYDRDDFLSFSAKRLFPGVDDFDAELGQPFPDSHSAYFDSERVWNKIRSVGVA
jgi:pimeloyl-ACP methyl ester carboxylesterase